MNYFPLTTEQQEWKERVAEIAAREIGPHAATTDRLAQYPRESLETLRAAKLWALRTPREYDGLGADLVTTCLVVEEIAKKCPSTGMCYKMHLEATEVGEPYSDALSSRTLRETAGARRGVRDDCRRRNGWSNRE